MLVAACSSANDEPIAEASLAVEAEPSFPGSTMKLEPPTGGCGIIGSSCTDGTICCANLRCLNDDTSPTGARCCHGYVDPDTEDLGCW
jgi:hypothetical protein